MISIYFHRRKFIPKIVYIQLLILGVLNPEFSISKINKDEVMDRCVGNCNKKEDNPEIFNSVLMNNTLGGL